MADPMQIQAQVQDSVTEVKVQMKYAPETGLRKDAAGKIIPAKFIQSVSVRHKDKDVLVAQFGPTVPKDPFLSFKFKGGAKGDKISVLWIDNNGEKRVDDAFVS